MVFRSSVVKQTHNNTISLALAFRIYTSGHLTYCSLIFIFLLFLAGEVIDPCLGSIR